MYNHNLSTNEFLYIFYVKATHKLEFIEKNLTNKKIVYEETSKILESFNLLKTETQNLELIKFYERIENLIFYSIHKKNSMLPRVINIIKKIYQ